jgi:hypothetical protein
MRKCYGHTCGSEAILALTEIALVEGKRVIGRKVKKGVPSKKEVKGTETKKPSDVITRTYLSGKRH